MSRTPSFPGAHAVSGADAAAALAALSWLVDAGVDSLVDDTPVSWLAAPAPAPKPTPATATADSEPATGAGHDTPARKTRTAPAASAIDVAGLPARAAAATTLEALAVLADEAAVARGAGRATLFADGNPAARVMVLGDMPSADDIAAGRLFAGHGGQLLDRMLAAIGRDRADTYLANLLACPIAGGRAPQPDEIAAQLPLVRRQIELVRPHALLVLGGVAAAALLGVDSGINRLRGRWQTLRVGDFNVPVLPSFAPAYLVAHPTHKALAWRDLLMFKSAVAAATSSMDIAAS